MSTIKDRLPIEFLDEMKSLLKDEYDAFLNSYDEEKTSSLRINTLKIDKDKFKELGIFNIDFNKDSIPWSDEGYYLNSDVFPGKSPLHDAGAFYLQEPSAMSVVGNTDISEGEKILDLCAAPGGKSTYILSKLNNTGLLVSNEINNTRVKALGENIERFGAGNVVITNTSSDKLLKFFKGYFDKIFIDAPCSGQGMFRKDEYAITDWSEDKVVECSAIQKDIIKDSFDMLKEGGMIIYSTCTFTERENEDIINEFLEHNSNSRLVSMERIWPHREKGEGHFCSRIEKISDEEFLDVQFDHNGDNKYKKKKQKIKENRRVNSNSVKLFEEFKEIVFVENSLFENNTRDFELKEHKDMIYLIPKLGIDLSGLKVMRSGLCLGELKKNRFEPSHSLAMALKPNDVVNYIDFAHDSDEISKYLYGESMNTGGNRGWILVCVEGVSLGWGKESNGVLKNKYPKGLRRLIK